MLQVKAGELSALRIKANRQLLRLHEQAIEVRPFPRVPFSDPSGRLGQLPS